ncbi:PA0069 family radical SAM protein [Pelomonas sp. V22]|uniref:PA0069 family radical SAM protein n=1 Tax=Pelomonas sp. V22 TaxID=2822139 RepID=UPI0024A845DE|nr:PA0069 family radical SAM protein [Pelomonas sp. V22]MDI4632296.1 PA0069 family radical SAM protein [Pelomonas sp. V22]
MPFKPSTNAKPALAQPLYVQADALKGRGSAWAIKHRFSKDLREQYDDGWGSLEQEASEEHLPPATQIIEEQAKSILSTNQSPDIGFDISINPYRGCEHGCIYCFARPTHSYLNMSPGLDFETRIIAKMNAPERLREALSKPGYKPRMLCMGTATDVYQPVERELQITRRIVELLAECEHAFSVVTKSSGIERDLDLIAPMAARNQMAVYVSVTTLDPHLARTLEPRAAAPHRRLRTIKTLAEAGVPVGVSVSPLIPFLNEPELERILEAAAEAGASMAFSIPLRLPWEVDPLFQDWLQQHQPDKAARVMARLREMRGGRDNDPNFGTRMTGEGIWAQLLRQRLNKAAARFGLMRERAPLDLSRFRPPGAAVAADAAQGELF